MAKWDISNLEIGDYGPHPYYAVDNGLLVMFNNFEEAKKEGFHIWAALTNEGHRINNLELYREIYKKEPAAYAVTKGYGEKCIHGIALNKK